MSFQATLSDPESLPVKRWKPLTETQRKVLSLLDLGQTQTSIANVLHLSRPRINQIVKHLESLSLIKRVQNNPKREGVRSYSYFYELSVRAKHLIQKDVKQETFIETPARAHHFRRKIDILQQTTPLSEDRRTGFVKSWKMRGWMGRKYWFSKTVNNLSVSIDVNPKNIICYLDRGQMILARTVEEAEMIGWAAISEAKRQFAEKQAEFGTFIILEDVGQQIGNIHYGFLMETKNPMFQEVIENGGQVGYADYHGDKSPEEQLGPGIGEIETERRTHATRLAAAIPIAEALPEAIQELAKLGPLTNEVHTVLAHITSGMSVDSRLNQLILLFGDTLKQQHQLLDQQAQILGIMQKNGLM